MARERRHTVAMIWAVILSCIGGFFWYGIWAIQDIPDTIGFDIGAGFIWCVRQALYLLVENFTAILAIVGGIGMILGRQSRTIPLFMGAVIIMAGSLLFLVGEPYLQRTRGMAVPTELIESGPQEAEDSMLAHRTLFSAAEQSGGGGLGVEAEPIPSAPLTAAEYLAQARAFARQQDWVSAHYTALQVLDIDAGNLEAQRLIEEAYGYIIAQRQNREERDQQVLYARIEAAYRELIAGDDRLDAYILFWELLQESPELNADIQHYYERAQNESRAVTIFSDELEYAAGFLPQGSAVFWSDAAERSVVIIRHVVPTPLGVYLYDIEVWMMEGDRVRAFQSPWGKIVEAASSDPYDTMVFRVADLSNPVTQFVPEWIDTDRRNAADLNNAAAPIAIPIFPAGTGELIPIRFLVPQLARAAFAPEQLNLQELWRLIPELSRYGFDSHTLRLAMVDRLTIPATFALFFVLGMMAAICLGTFEVEQSSFIRPKIGGVMVFFPLILGAAHITSNLYRYGTHIFHTRMLMHLSTGGAAALIGVGHFVMLTGSLILFMSMFRKRNLGT